jgi:outer membrane protein
MKMKRILIYTFLLPVSLMAQQTLTVNNAIDTALKYNFDIQIARNLSEIGRINNSLGVAGGLPSLNISGTNNNSQYDLKQKTSSGINIEKNDVSNHSINSAATASITLFNGFKVLATKERLSILQSQSELQLNQQIQNTIASVMSAYYDILRQQDYLKIITTSLDVSRQKSNIVSERYNVGMANEADMLQAQMDLNLAEQNLRNQVLAVDQGKISLLQLMGVRDFFPVEIMDTIEVDTAIQKDAILNTLEKNPQYLSAESQVRINEQIVKEIRAQRLPLLRVNAGYSFTYNSSSAGFNLFTQNLGPTAGATLQIPVFNGTIYKTQQDVASFNVKNAELQKESLLNTLRADALKTYQEYESTLHQIRSQKDVYEKSKKLVDIVIHRFELNQATILEVKAAQASYENAGYMLVNLEFAAKLAEIELKRLVFMLE